MHNTRDINKQPSFQAQRLSKVLTNRAFNSCCLFQNFILKLLGAHYLGTKQEVIKDLISQHSPSLQLLVGKSLQEVNLQVGLSII